MSDADTVALVEVGDSHDECLHAQIEYLRRHDFRVHLILSQRVQQRAGRFENVDRTVVVPAMRGLGQAWRVAFWIQRYLRNEKIQTAVLNTAHGRVVRNFCLIAGRNIRLLGILHGARKLLQRSFTQRIISRRIETYFVLNDYIRDHVLAVRPEAPVTSLYPVYLPGCEAGVLNSQNELSQPFTICIPGPVHSSRRDYDGLLDMLAADTLPPNVRFVLLGQCSEETYARLTARFAAINLVDRFILFREFVSQEEFHRQLVACNLVMPLIHPQTPNFSLYRTLQITGSFNLAFAYRKPLLMHRGFSDVEDFQRTACFYDDSDLTKVLGRLASDRDALTKQQEELRTWEKLQVAYQAQRYAAAVGRGGALRPAA